MLLLALSKFSTYHKVSKFGKKVTNLKREKKKKTLRNCELPDIMYIDQLKIYLGKLKD